MRALVIVDVQNDFCEGGSLAVAGGAAVARAITGYLAGPNRVRYDYIVASQDFHIEPGSHFADEPDYFRSWPRHCVVGTQGAQFHPDLDTSEIDEIFRKGQYSAAYSGFEGASEAGDTLTSWLRERGVREIDVAGIATDYCVYATASDAAKGGLTTTVLLNLTAGVATQTVTSALSSLRANGVTLTGTPVGPVEAPG